MRTIHRSLTALADIIFGARNHDVPAAQEDGYKARHVCIAFHTGNIAVCYPVATSSFKEHINHLNNDRYALIHAQAPSRDGSSVVFQNRLLPISEALAVEIYFEMHKVGAPLRAVAFKLVGHEKGQHGDIHFLCNYDDWAKQGFQPSYVYLSQHPQFSERFRSITLDPELTASNEFAFFDYRFKWENHLNLPAPGDGDSAKEGLIKARRGRVRLIPGGPENI